MNVKIISTNNFNTTYVVLNEKDDLYELLDESGSFLQLKKNKIEIDGINEVSAVQAYQMIDNPDILENILKARCQNELKSIEGTLNVKLSSLENSKVSFHDNSNNTYATILYSNFCPKKEHCEIDIWDYQLNSQKDGMRELVVLVLEEFGTFYLDGQHLRSYLSSHRPSTKKGKKYWTLKVNYDDLIHIPGAPAFNHYSNDISYIKNFTFGRTGYDNVTSLDAIRTVQNLQNDLKTKRNGFRVNKKSA